MIQSLTFSHPRVFGVLLFHRLSTITTTTDPHFMVDFLATSCGFSSDQATKASSRLTHLESPQKPQSFIDFMRTRGFTDTHIRKIASHNPRFLCLDVDANLAPKFQSFHEFGFSQSQITDLIVSNPCVLRGDFHRQILPKIKFWQSLLGGSNDNLVKLFKNTVSHFLSYSIEKRVMPNLSLLRSCEISDERAAMVIQKSPRLILQKSAALADIISRVENEMGIPRSSKMFLWGLWTLHVMGKARFSANLELLRGFGWSEAEFLCAFRKAPIFLSVSRRMLVKKMDFLVKEVGCEPSDVAFDPRLLMYSLEGRLIPRHRVFKILESRELVTRKHKFSTIVSYSEKVFIERFVVPYKDKAPELQEIL